MNYGSGKWNCNDYEYPRSFKHGPGHHWFFHHAQSHEYRWECAMCNEKYKHKYAVLNHLNDKYPLKNIYNCLRKKACAFLKRFRMIYHFFFQQNVMVTV